MCLGQIVVYRRPGSDKVVHWLGDVSGDQLRYPRKDAELSHENGLILQHLPQLEGCSVADGMAGALLPLTWLPNWRLPAAAHACTAHRHQGTTLPHAPGRP